MDQLNQDLKVLDEEYNKLSDHVAKGERDSHNQELLDSICGFQRWIPHLRFQFFNASRSTFEMLLECLPQENTCNPGGRQRLKGS